MVLRRQHRPGHPSLMLGRSYKTATRSTCAFKRSDASLCIWFTCFCSSTIFTPRVVFFCRTVRRSSSSLATFWFSNATFGMFKVTAIVPSSCSSSECSSDPSSARVGLATVCLVNRISPYLPGLGMSRFGKCRSAQSSGLLAFWRGWLHANL